MVGSLFAKVAFYPTVGYTLLMSKVSSRKYYNRIDDTVILGALPLKGILKTLISEEEISSIISVNEDFELQGFLPTPKELRAIGIDHLQLPTVDFVGTPSQCDIQKAVDFIAHYREVGERVYVHCKAGRTRSATVVACYLMHTYGCNPEQSVDLIMSKRPHVWLREKQLESIKTFYKSLRHERGRCT